MNDANTSKKNHETHKAAAEFATPFTAMMGVFAKEALRVADEAEKGVERSLQEMKRANHEGNRLWESQLEMSASVSRAAFDSMRRMWNV